MPRLQWIVLLGATAAASAALAQTAPANLDVARGSQVAHSLCAACHAVDKAGASPRADAPPFRSLAVRGNPIALERTLRTLSKTAHGDMRPVALSPEDGMALAAYIQSLEPRDR